MELSNVEARTRWKGKETRDNLFVRQHFEEFGMEKIINNEIETATQTAEYFDRKYFKIGFQ